MSRRRTPTRKRTPVLRERRPTLTPAGKRRAHRQDRREARRIVRRAWLLDEVAA